MSKLQLGFGRADITPTFPVPLTGYGNEAKRYSETVLDPLYATCLAFTDEDGSTALVYAVDMLYMSNWIRPVIGEAVGLPVERIQLSGSHTHAGPGCWPERPYPGNKEYLMGTFKSGVIQAAELALADRKPVAEISIGGTRVERMNFVRHYLMSDGSYSGPNFGNHKLPIVAHETEADNLLQVIKFAREGAQDVIIGNFQAHQTMTGGMNKHDISADYSGAMRRKMEEEQNCKFAFFTGACGNVGPESRIEGEGRFEEEEYIEYGQALADHVVEAMANLRPVKMGKVKAVSLPLDIDVNHSLDHMQDIARDIVKVWKDTGDRAACNVVCRQHGLNSVYHAESILDKLVLGKTLDIELNAVSVGDIAFAMVPYEMFDTNGMELKEGSPFEMTVVATCSNNVRSYIPSALGFEHGGYSADRCRFVPGTGERLVEEFITMLNKMHD